ncbi:hypothetical protein VTP01DRAFT_1218 [Rhizomucor pusillus]|uniref:uncharacterized protein n=1 Tax=Rhizomucor pusillus TaxID=4840 RepID=UPI0037447C24
MKAFATYILAVVFNALKSESSLPMRNPIISGLRPVPSGYAMLDAKTRDQQRDNEVVGWFSDILHILRKWLINPQLKLYTEQGATCCERVRALDFTYRFQQYPISSGHF